MKYQTSANAVRRLYEILFKALFSENSFLIKFEMFYQIYDMWAISL